MNCPSSDRVAANRTEQELLKLYHCLHSLINDRREPFALRLVQSVESLLDEVRGELAEVRAPKSLDDIRQWAESDVQQDGVMRLLALYEDQRGGEGIWCADYLSDIVYDQPEVIRALLADRSVKTLEEVVAWLEAHLPADQQELVQ